MSRPVLAIRDLTLGFKGWRGETEVLHGISVTIDPGERVALVGESGRQSVTARIVLGLLHRCARRGSAGRSSSTARPAGMSPAEADTCAAPACR